jgi:hypothetical protein
MLRDLSVRTLSGDRILGLFTPPAGSGEPVEHLMLSLALACAESHASSGAVVWSSFEPVTIYSPWRSHAPYNRR